MREAAARATPQAEGPAAPPVAYVLLWFPKPSETFVFREAQGLAGLGLPLTVFTLYGRWRRQLSAEMRACRLPVERLGVAAVPRLASALALWAWRRPREVARLCREIPFRRWRDLEAAAENLWAFCCGFEIARRSRRLGIAHLHAAWATGPATAAWVAARLVGIPFSFSGCSRDVFPPDGSLHEKMRDAVFVRTDVPSHAPYLEAVAGRHASKVRTVLTGLTLAGSRPAPVPMRPPYHVVALGRFVPKKGFTVLLQACALLAQRGVDFRLTLAGGRSRKLDRLARQLGVRERVAFPGFLPHDQVPALLSSADVFVAPSVVAADGDRDGIPNVLLEALAHRLPVVGTAVGRLTDVIEDGVTGLLVPAHDPDALADAIARLFSDRRAALRMAAAGESRVRPRFDPERCQRQLLGLFAASRQGIDLPPTE